MEQNWLMKIKKNWLIGITRGIPAVFLVYMFLSALFRSDYGSNFWSFWLPEFMSETFIYCDLPWIIRDVFGLSTVIFFLTPCHSIVAQNKGRLCPWIVVIVFTIDILGLVCLFFTGNAHIPRSAIWPIILAELALVLSQIVNLVQKSKLERAQNV